VGKKMTDEDLTVDRNEAYLVTHEADPILPYVSTFLTRGFNMNGLQGLHAFQVRTPRQWHNSKHLRGLYEKAEFVFGIQTKSLQ
jgi:hypothetical protein